MPTHVHVGGMQFLIDGAIIILWLFVFRALEIKFPDTAIGRAMAFIH